MTTTGEPGRLRVAARVVDTAAEGPGRRYALWLAGCSLRCPGCCNPELFDPRAGEDVAVEALAAEILGAARAHALDGVTLLGGEPLEQMAGVTALVGALAGHGLGVILFTGHTLEEARALDGFARLEPALDTIVDGRFDAARREPRVGGRRWIGSTNQRLVHLTSRYADAALWGGPAHVDVRVGSDGAVAVHGDPELARRLLRRFPGSTAV